MEWVGLLLDAEKWFNFWKELLICIHICLIWTIICPQRSQMWTKNAYGIYIPAKLLSFWGTSSALEASCCWAPYVPLPLSQTNENIPGENTGPKGITKHKHLRWWDANSLAYWGKAAAPLTVWIYYVTTKCSLVQSHWKGIGITQYLPMKCY